MKKSKLYVQVKTKSNFRNLNDIWLEVIEIFDTRVTVTAYCPEEGKFKTCDFHLKECKKIQYQTFKAHDIETLGHSYIIK
jgi:hypothetical protein